MICCGRKASFVASPCDPDHLRTLVTCDLVDTPRRTFGRESDYAQRLNCFADSVFLAGAVCVDAHIIENANVTERIDKQSMTDLGVLLGNDGKPVEGAAVMVYRMRMKEDGTDPATKASECMDSFARGRVNRRRHRRFRLVVEDEFSVVWDLPNS